MISARKMKAVTMQVKEPPQEDPKVKKITYTEKIKHEHGNGVTTKIWEQGEKLGAGTMGELYIFIDTETRIKYACKRISKK